MQKVDNTNWCGNTGDSQYDDLIYHTGILWGFQ